MAIEAGRIVTVADFQRLVGTETVRTTTSAGFTTTETILDSVTVSLTAGLIYRITWDTQFGTSTAGTTLAAIERVRGQIRLTNVSGTVLQLRDTLIVSGGGVSHPAYLQGEYQAASTGSQTFVATGQRQVGTGTITSAAVGTSSVFLRVEIV